MSLETKHAILDALRDVLDEEHAVGLIDHRKAKKAPLTLLAAKILIKQLRLCPDPNEAVEEMINRNWTGLKAEWLRKAQSRPSKRTVFDVAAERFNGPEGVFGGGRNVELIPGRQQQPGPDDGDLRSGFAGALPSVHH
jgi:hypothetical protein